MIMHKADGYVVVELNLVSRDRLFAFTKTVNNDFQNNKQRIVFISTRDVVNIAFKTEAHKVLSNIAEFGTIKNDSLRELQPKEQQRNSCKTTIHSIILRK